MMPSQWYLGIILLVAIGTAERANAVGQELRSSGSSAGKCSQSSHSMEDAEAGAE